MGGELLKAFWNCGDDQIIQFAIQRAHLNKKELQVITMILDECMTQEEVAEQLNYSTRRIQDFWYSGANKLLNIKWVEAFAKELNSL
ncbi:MAG: hypothetical protein KBT03_06145 [Bacteroidales bacterium]|nr:hypothetical protein [Candidatus Scybalousia scybalohippi]